MSPFHIIFLSLTFFFFKTSHAQEEEYLLPDIYVPYSYSIHINISADAFTENGDQFQGTSLVSFQVSNDTTELKLHSSYEYITINSILLDNVEVPNNTYSVNNVTDILTIANVTLFVQQYYTLIIDYTGRLSTTDMYGFYKSSYVDSNNVTRYLATTQFEPTRARRAFPCFDEPALKATFDIAFTHPTELNVLSNADVSVTAVGTNETTTEFKTTAKMSTYLVAFIVSPFTCTVGDFIEPNNTVPYQVCSREEAEDERGWAVEIGAKLLQSLVSYTNFSYNASMPKMDQVAIPDFASGAMENWGLVTYRERYLLWNQNESSTSYKQSIATIIAHEFAHQWFGNLVTMKWWSETYLNEGFATVFEFFTTHEVLPEWELDKQFVIKVLQSIFASDCYLSAQSIKSNATTPAEISAKFGSITYDKGGSILRMVESIMGKENFRDGLRNYLVTHQYSNTVSEDLWTSLNGSLNNSISKLPTDLGIVMTNWIEKSGYPVLTVALNGTNVTISQERFLLSGNDTESKWYVPISYTTSVDENKFESTLPATWLTPDDNLTITLPSNATWIILNNQQTGYYRVSYSSSILNNIGSALLQANFSDISVINRAQIVDDILNLARANRTQYSTAFNVIEFLRNDTSYITWYPAFTQFNYLIRRIGLGSTLGQAVANHVLRLTENLRASLPLTVLNETEHIYTLNQVLAATWACRLGNEECVEHIQEMFEKYKNSSTIPNKNLKSIVYCNALRYSSNQSSDWDVLWKAYQATDIATEKAMFITAMGCATNETILVEYLQKSITEDSGIRSQDASSVYSAVYSGGPAGVDIALNFFIENYDAILARYNNLNSMASLIQGVAGYFTTEEQINKLKNFTANGTLEEDFITSATGAIETAESNLAWLAEFKDDLLAYYNITEDVPTTVSTSTSTSTTTSTSTSTTTEASLTTADDGAISIKSSFSFIVAIVLIFNVFFT